MCAFTKYSHFYAKRRWYSANAKRAKHWLAWEIVFIAMLGNRLTLPFFSSSTSPYLLINYLFPYAVAWRKRNKNYCLMQRHFTNQHKIMPVKHAYLTTNMSKLLKDLLRLSRKYLKSPNCVFVFHLGVG